MSDSDRHRTEELNLRSDFTEPSFEEWTKAAELALSKAEKPSFEAAGNSIPWQPIFREQDLTDLSHHQSFPGSFPFVRGTRAAGHAGRGWLVYQENPASIVEQFSAIAIGDFKRVPGSIMLGLDLAGQVGLDPDAARMGDVGWAGVSISTQREFERALEKIDPAQTEMRLRCGLSGLQVMAWLLSWARTQGLTASDISGHLTFDPLDHLAAYGSLPVELNHCYDEMYRLIGYASQETALRTIQVSSAIYHNAGLSASEQLACQMATVVEYFRQMQRRGLSVDQVNAQMTFEVAVGSNYFTETAKLRSCRLLWSRLAELCEFAPESVCPPVHAVTSEITGAIHDHHVNILRATTEAFAAVVGSCDSLTIRTFDHASASPDQFSRRLAMNTHLILRHECHLDAVGDPGGGSYYIEWLTEQIAREAWNRFIEIEKTGGIYRALQSGLIHQWSGARVGRKTERLARGRDVIVGTNKYVQVEEPIKKRDLVDYERLHLERTEEVAAYRASLDQTQAGKCVAAVKKAWSGNPEELMTALCEAASCGATLGELTKALRGDQTSSVRIDSLAKYRPSEMFEHLRSVVTGLKKEESNAPRIMIAAVGDTARLQPRISFVCELFAVAGLHPIFDHAYITADEAVWAVSETIPEVVVLVGEDKAYPDMVPVMAGLIKENSPDCLVYLAGFPADHVDRFKQAGVDEFIYPGVDMYDLLVKLGRHLGVLV